MKGTDTLKIEDGETGHAAPGLDEFICFAIYSTNHAFTRVYAPILETLGVTYPQYLVMVCLWRQDGQTVGELARGLFLESSTLTPLLKRLEAMGLIHRRRSIEDGRQVHVWLSAEGHALKQKAADVPVDILAATGLDAEAVARLRREVEGLRAALTR